MFRDLVCVLGGAAIGHFCVGLSCVSGPSMEPTLLEGDVVLSLNPKLYWTYHRCFRRLDQDSLACYKKKIITIRTVVGAEEWKNADPVADGLPEKVFCKRVVALARKNEVNEPELSTSHDQALDLYDEDASHDTTGAAEMTEWFAEADRRRAAVEFVEGESHLWIEGDNPPLSHDSRSFGPVHPSRLHGLVVAVVWPLSRVGPVK